MRQGDCKGSAAARRRRHVDLAVVRPDDFLRDGEPESCSARFMGRERSKKIGKGFRRHAAAVVRDADNDLIQIFSGGKRHAAVLSRGLEGVFEQIQERLAQLDGISEDRRKLGRQMDGEILPVGQDIGLQAFLQGENDLLQICFTHEKAAVVAVHCKVVQKLVQVLYVFQRLRPELKVFDLRMSRLDKLKRAADQRQGITYFVYHFGDSKIEVFHVCITPVPEFTIAGILLQYRRIHQNSTKYDIYFKQKGRDRDYEREQLYFL